jgi:hypothetical protein
MELHIAGQLRLTARLSALLPGMLPSLVLARAQNRPGGRDSSYRLARSDCSTGMSPHHRLMHHPAAAPHWGATLKRDE